MKEVKTPNLAAVRNRFAVEPERQHLRSRDDSMLPTSQPGEQTVGSGQLGGTIALK
jgi:hypothetical protein